MLKQLLFEPGDHSVRLKEDETQVAFYIEDLECPDYVVQKVVEIFNSANDMTELDNYMMEEEMLIQEDRETIIEGIFELL